MSKKSYIIYIILLILVVFGIGIMVYARFRTPSFEAAEQSESTDAVTTVDFITCMATNCPKKGINLPKNGHPLYLQTTITASSCYRSIWLITKINQSAILLYRSLTALYHLLPQQTSKSFYASYTTGTETHFKVNRLPLNRFPATWMTLPLS